MDVHSVVNILLHNMMSLNYSIVVSFAILLNKNQGFIQKHFKVRSGGGEIFNFSNVRRGKLP